MSMYDDENNEAGLTVSHRQASLVLAGCLLGVFFSFVSGYFWGKKNAASQFVMKTQQDSFAGQIYSSMCELCQSDNDVKEMPDQQKESVNVAQGKELAQEKLEKVTTKIDSSPEKIKEEKVFYTAQLIGFGTKKNALTFANKLNDQGIPVEIRSRKSKSAKGKTVSWYQVVTQKYENKGELEKLVAHVSKKERLKGVQIIAC